MSPLFFLSTQKKISIKIKPNGIHHHISSPYLFTFFVQLKHLDLRLKSIETNPQICQISLSDFLFFFVNTSVVVVAIVSI